MICEVCGEPMQDRGSEWWCFNCNITVEKVKVVAIGDEGKGA